MVKISKIKYQKLKLRHPPDGGTIFSTTKMPRLNKLDRGIYNLMVITRQNEQKLC
jgi:hypothetical protein